MIIHEQMETDSPKCPGRHTLVLCSVNLCPHPSHTPAVPEEHLVPISLVLGEKQVNIINGVCSAYQQVWKYIYIFLSGHVQAS